MNTGERVIAIAREHLGETDSRPFIARAAPCYAPHDRPEWCGIFVRFCWLAAGLDVPEWVMSSGNTSYLARTSDPQPGDLCSWHGAGGHQSIFIRREGARILEIGGNTIGTARDGKQSYSCVAEKWRNVSTLAGAYSMPAAPAELDPVRRAQAALAAAGYYAGKIDGAWGPVSAAAGKRWIIDHPYLIVR